MPHFCRFCGKELKKHDARFCHACGRQLTPSTPSDAGPDTQEQPHIVIRMPGRPLQTEPLSNPTITIGRQSDNDIVLLPKYVSGRHGKLEQQQEVWQYTDLDSTNGTFVNGQRTQSTDLRDGDILRIGDPEGNSISLTFRTGDAAGDSAPVVGPIRIGATALGMQSSLTIGRDPQADVPLSAPIISWRHARLDRTAQGHTLTDLKSTNGTFLNGQRISGSAPLKSGDVIGLGQAVNLVFSEPGVPEVKDVRDMLPASPEVPEGMAQTMIGEALPMDAQLATPPQFLINVAGAAPQAFTLSSDSITIGRNEDNDVVVASNIVSRNHARLERSNGGYRIVVLPQASNPVYVDGYPITAPHQLRHNDKLRIGGQVQRPAPTSCLRARSLCRGDARAAPAD